MCFQCSLSIVLKVTCKLLIHSSRQECLLFRVVLHLYNCTTVTPAATQKRSLIIIPKDESAYEHQRQTGKQSLSPLNKRDGLKNGRLYKSFFSPRHESIVVKLQYVSILSGHLYSALDRKKGLTDKRLGCSARVP